MQYILKKNNYILLLDGESVHKNVHNFHNSYLVIHFSQRWQRKSLNHCFSRLSIVIFFFFFAISDFSNKQSIFIYSTYNHDERFRDVSKPSCLFECQTPKCHYSICVHYNHQTRSTTFFSDKTHLYDLSFHFIKKKEGKGKGKQH